MPNGEEVLEPGRNTLAAVGAGVLVVIAGFMVYNYFTRSGRGAETNIAGGEINVSEEEGLTLPSPEEITGEEGQIVSAENENAVDEGGEEKPADQPASEEANQETNQATDEGPFVLNDLSPNSISGESYTVNRGDTLWEIAEARYGSGFEWGKILEANKDNIGFLPNGSQALITPGQTLVLPE